VLCSRCILEVITYTHDRRHWLEQVNVMRKKLMLYCLGMLYDAQGSQEHNRNHRAVLTPLGRRDEWCWVLRPPLPKDSPMSERGEGKGRFVRKDETFYQTSCHGREEQQAFQHTSL